MSKIIIAGIGTNVGKTIISAILTTLVGGDYWKPIQCGQEETSDTTLMKNLIDRNHHQIHPPAYSFHAPLSPHHASRLEETTINAHSILLPQTNRALIIESVGGIYVPLTSSMLSIDIFKTWNNCRWVIVSKHYLGSINHTLLTIECLRKQDVSIAGIVFNGEPDPDTEAMILDMSKMTLLGRLLPEETINSQTIQRYAKQWQCCLPKLLH